MGGEWVGTGWARDFLQTVVVISKALRDIADGVTSKQREADWTLRDELAWQILREGRFHVQVPTGQSEDQVKELQRQTWARNIDGAYRAVDFFMARREVARGAK